jgi:hypothetical protein
MLFQDAHGRGITPLFDISSPSEGILLSICAATRDLCGSSTKTQVFLFIFLGGLRPPNLSNAMVQLPSRLRWSAIEDVRWDEFGNRYGCTNYSKVGCFLQVETMIRTLKPKV